MLQKFLYGSRLLLQGRFSNLGMILKRPTADLFLLVWLVFDVIDENMT